MGAQPRTPEHDTVPNRDQRLQAGQSAIDSYRVWRQDFLVPRMKGRAPTSTAK